MTTRRLISRAIAATAVAMSLAACADSTAPSTPTVPPSAVRVQPPSFDIAGLSIPLTLVGDTATARFTVYPWSSQTFVFEGTNAIKFSASSICDPAISSYGPTQWDKPCSPTTRPVTITVKKFHNAFGALTTEFQPALRFNPASNGVFLYLEDDDRTISPWFKQINYCTDLGVCIDEALTDPSLATYYNSYKNLHARRIKHFSGYSVAIGRSDSDY
jgi:hypothetical protein